VPLAVHAYGRRLAQRDGAVTLPDLAAIGVGPTAVLALIADSLGLPAPRRIEDLLSSFDPSTLPRDPWVFPGNRTR
jgi:glutamyl-tRNA synthetase